MDTELRTLVVDDEPLARQGLLAYAREAGFINVIAECSKAMEANKVLNEQACDLILLDIQMPRLTGLNFLKTLRQPPLVIITSAYSQYALEGYELDVVDYLVKPYSFERFLKAANKALEIHKLRKTKLSDSGLNVPDTPEYFFIKVDQRYERINMSEIVYIEGMENYVIIHTENARLVTMSTLKTMESQLMPGRFVRIHKSYIVALDKVSAIEGNMLKIGKTELPIGRQKRAEVMTLLLGNKD